MYGNYGKLNPFFGKKHSDETKKKIVKNRDYSVFKTEEFRKKISEVTKGDKNPMYGKSVFDVWIKKYGIDIANEKMVDLKNKQSFNSIGEKNNMYGKPSPLNSGNGICGWYKGWFFRSLLELSYMLYVIERFNLMWENGELEDNKIPYFEGDIKRNYFPDFIINKRYVVECKPKKLWLTEKNKLKFEYAKKYCENNNLIFKVRDINKIKKQELLRLIDDGLVILTNKWKNFN
jgi:hypothetical protein